MKRACISIGIDRYHHFQPLRFAQNDARAFRDVLLQDDPAAAPQCWCIAENSPPLQGGSTYPTRENLWRWLQLVADNPSMADRLLWCFFSGYGIAREGIDYIMPIDGDPKDPENTGIRTRSLLELLRDARAAKVLLVLDAGRPEVARSGDPFGAETVQMARQLEVPTILSCQPGEFSRETSGWNHGIFTFALLEGLRLRQRPTLESLDRYLVDRVPELCQHNFLPEQVPLTVATPEQNRMVLLPKVGAIVGARTVDREDSAAEAEPATTNGNGAIVTEDPEAIASPTPSNGSRHEGEPTPETPIVPEEVTPAPAATNGNGTGVATPVPTAEGSDGDLDSSPVGWLQLLLGGGLAVIVAILGLWLGENWLAPEEEQTITIAPVPSLDESPQPPEATDLPPETADPVPEETTPPVSSAPTTVPEAETPEPEAQPETPAPTETIPPVSSAPTTVPEAETPAPTEVPAATPEAEAQPEPPAPIEVPASPAAGTGDIIATANAKLEPLDPQTYAEAIADVQQISSNSPQYAEAQRLITRWSDWIVRIARTRAFGGDIEGAIAAAALVPENTPSYEVAQREIAAWQNQD